MKEKQYRKMEKIADDLLILRGLMEYGLKEEEQDAAYFAQISYIHQIERIKKDVHKLLRTDRHNNKKRIR